MQTHVEKGGTACIRNNLTGLREKKLLVALCTWVGSYDFLAAKELESLLKYILGTVPLFDNFNILRINFKLICTTALLDRWLDQAFKAFMYI
jgi:hypothetical protein